MIKDVMVYLDGSPIDEVRLATGSALAELFQAHLTGLFLNILPDVVPPMEPPDVGAQLSATLMQQARDLGDRNEAMIAERLALFDGPAAIRRFDIFTDQIGALAAREARSVDTFVTTKPSFDASSSPPDDLVDGVLLGSGRHLFLASDHAPSSRTFDRILVAWNASREATHAVAEAIPFLSRAPNVTIIVVNEDRLPGDDPTPGVNLTRHLLNHGIDATLDYVDRNGNSVSEILIVEAQRRDANLIVMGGYSHSRLRQRIFGGVTYDLIHQSSIPLLIAH